MQTSFVNTHLKEKAKQYELKHDKSNVHIGNVGDRIEIKVASARVLYVRDNRCYSYYADNTYVWEIKDEKGHTFIWNASTDEINVGDKIKATIKAHDNRRGVKQTKITRGKVVE